MPWVFPTKPFATQPETHAASGWVDHKNMKGTHNFSYGTVGTNTKIHKRANSDTLDKTARPKICLVRDINQPVKQTERKNRLILYFFMTLRCPLVLIYTTSCFI